MTSQLALNIIPRIRYEPDEFLLHSGVGQLFQECWETLRTPGFSLQYICGAPRCGKTHFAIRMASALGAADRYARIVSASDFVGWTIELEEKQHISQEEVYIIDDAQRYLATCYAGQSGPFVKTIERLRVAGASILFLSVQHYADFPNDDHVRSRLKEGFYFDFGQPGRDELPALIGLLSRQQGLVLNKRKIDYLARRLPNNIAEIESYLGRVHTISKRTGTGLDFQVLSEALDGTYTFFVPDEDDSE